MLGDDRISGVDQQHLQVVVANRLLQLGQLNVDDQVCRQGPGTVADELCQPSWRNLKDELVLARTHSVQPAEATPRGVSDPVIAGATPGGVDVDHTSTLGREISDLDGNVTEVQEAVGLGAWRLVEILRGQNPFPWDDVQPTQPLLVRVLKADQG